MHELYQVARVMLILGIAGTIVSFVLMIGAFLTKCPLWLTVGVSVTTIVTGIVIGKKVKWL